MTDTIKPRLRYFDMLKGVAIFLVVMGHVLAFCVREIDRAAIFKFIEQIHMPLFFFVSGWFCVKPKLKQRALRLLVPMVAVSSLWVLYFPHSGLGTPLNSTFAGLWTDVWKNGYWFTLVLFEIILIYAAVKPLLDKCSSFISVAAFTALVSIAMIVLSFIFPQQLIGIASFNLVATFFPIFMIGVLARRNSDGFMKLVHSSGWQTLMIVVFAVTLYVCSWRWEFNIDENMVVFPKIFLHLSAAFISVALFESWANKAFAPGASLLTSRVASCWEYLGTQSLAIYLLHYFFLFPMGGFRPMLESMNLAFVPLALFAAFWAVIIIAAVLLIVRLISPSRILTLLLTGNK